MSTQSPPSTLLDLIAHQPSEKVAVILPEPHITVTYGALRAQVQALAAQLAAAGINRGDRVATSLPNGLPMIVSFLAASVAGTAVQGGRVQVLPR
jgi:acyl-CoA synthetase (AMP-forming)/AMP-acid ligase II